MAKYFVLFAVVTALTSCFVSTLAVVGVVPQPQTQPVRPGSSSSMTSRTSSGSATSYRNAALAQNAGPSTVLADPETIEHAVNIYNALTTVIRDVVLKAKLTPIGGTEGVNYVESCAEHKAKGTGGPNIKSGVFTIWPTGKVLDGPKQVWCDMETEGGGWTVIQRRGYGSVSRAQAESFNKNWREYKVGFGTALKDYWLGLESIHVMGRRCTNELRVTLTYFDDTVKTAGYSNFTLGDEADNYRLHVAGFTSGNAGDVLEKKHDGLIFNTPDKDSEDKCGLETKSGWWFVSKKTKSWCDYVNLNGELKDKATDVGGMTWRYHSLLKGWTAPALKMAELKIRPKCPPA